MQGMVNSSDSIYWLQLTMIACMWKLLEKKMNEVMAHLDTKSFLIHSKMNIAENTENNKQILVS